MGSPIVTWWNKERGSWACTNFLNEIVDLYRCSHQFLPSPAPDGGIIVFHGGHCSVNGSGARSAEAINEYASKMPYVLFVNIGDEQAEFPLDLLSHPNMKTWCQTPGLKTKADRYMVEGYPFGTRASLTVLRDLDYYFAGQDTHTRRHECVSALRDRCGKTGICITTGGFGQGGSQAEYLEGLSRARIAPCPSGPTTPDTFRIWEALECGAVPIVDAFSPQDSSGEFWPKVLGEHPLTLIEDWSTLPEVMEKILADYDRINRFTQYWWKSYKLQMRTWLAKDLVALGVK